LPSAGAEEEAGTIVLLQSWLDTTFCGSGRLTGDSPASTTEASAVMSAFEFEFVFIVFCIFKRSS
jgi:hypothetical protein